MTTTPAHASSNRAGTPPIDDRATWQTTQDEPAAAHVEPSIDIDETMVIQSGDRAVTPTRADR